MKAGSQAVHWCSHAGGPHPAPAQGEIDADQLVAFLSAMGVELRGRWACCLRTARLGKEAR